MTRSDSPTLTYIGGPTALIEWRGARLLTDPTLDPAGSTYPTAAYTLVKTQGPAIAAAELPPIDVVLLSHDHHSDNLDRAGRALLAHVPQVITTPAGAARLDTAATGLASWEHIALDRGSAGILRITATPARHGPPQGDRGPVIGFVLAWDDAPADTVYVSGDTVWFDGVQEVAARFRVRTAILFLGAARVRAAGDWPLTFTAAEAVAAARAFADADIVPLHFEGWEHFSESRADVEQTFIRAGLAHRLHWPPRGVRAPLFPPRRCRREVPLHRRCREPLVPPTRTQTFADRRRVPAAASSARCATGRIRDSTAGDP